MRYPYHFYQIHKKVYNREFLLLDRWARREINQNQEGDVARSFFNHVHALAVKWFEDEAHPYNSRYRFQYCQSVEC